MAFHDTTRLHLAAGHRIAITYTCLEESAAAWLQTNISRRTSHVGIDAEWRPVFTPGAVGTLSVLQVATNDSVLVVQLNALRRARPESPSAGSLARFLESAVVFCGMGATHDLQKVHELLVAGDAAAAIRGQPPQFQTIDLKRYGQDRGVNVPGGLAGLAAHVLGKACKWKSKRLQMSNWARFPLAPSQLVYAAMDAWASLACWAALVARPPASPRGDRSEAPPAAAAAPRPSAAAAAPPAALTDRAGAPLAPVATAAACVRPAGGQLPLSGCRDFLHAVLAVCHGWASDKLVLLLLPREARPAGCRSLAKLAAACGLATDAAASCLFAPEDAPAAAGAPVPRYTLETCAGIGRLLAANGHTSIPSWEWGAALPPDCRPAGLRNSARQLAELSGFAVSDIDGGFSVALVAR